MAIRNFFIFTFIFLSASNSYAADKVIVAFGDSLSSGYGLDENSSFPKKLEVALIEKYPSIKVINSGVAGNTSENARERVADVIAYNPDLVILEFGSNDLMHHVQAEKVMENLDYVISEIKKNDTKILLCGVSKKFAMEDTEYEKYKQGYKNLAKKYDIDLFSDFLDGVSGNFELNQQDLIHPNAKGVDVIVKNILPYVKDLIN